MRDSRRVVPNTVIAWSQKSNPRTRKLRCSRSWIESIRNVALYTDGMCQKRRFTLKSEHHDGGRFRTGMKPADNTDGPAAGKPGRPPCAAR